MKFSVLLPTRNRLELLKYAVESVRRQDYDDWEIVVSDNFSADDIAGFVDSFNDPRIRYFRTAAFVSVTDNWNNALDHSTGDYVVMLGDDDCLMRGYFSTLARLMKEYPDPDFIYTSAFLFAYPGVVPGFPQGFLESQAYADFFRTAGNLRPFWLDRTAARSLVDRSLRFQIRVGYNMQFALVGRRLIDLMKEKGPFFQSPFPDYYAMNVMFLTSQRMLVCPLPLVTIGISPKSYGFFHFNRREKGGIAFLNGLPDREQARRLERVLLPGTNINTSWLFSMETICANYGQEFGLVVSYWRYRALQAIYVYNGRYVAKVVPQEDAAQLYRSLHLAEWPFYCFLFVVSAALGGRKGHLLQWLDRCLAQYPPWRPPKLSGRYRNILDVFTLVDPAHPPEPAAPS